MQKNKEEKKLNYDYGKMIVYLRPLDCLSSVSMDDAGDDSFCSGVMSALLDGERDLRTKQKQINLMNYSNQTNDSYRRRVRLDPDGVRGLRSRGDGDDDSLRFVLCSRLVRLRCIDVVDAAAAADVVVLRNKSRKKKHFLK